VKLAILAVKKSKNLIIRTIGKLENIRQIIRKLYKNIPENIMLLFSYFLHKNRATKFPRNSPKIKMK
jgi:hypothetical protein